MRSLLRIKLAELRDRSSALPSLQAAMTADVNPLNPTFWLDKDSADAPGAVYHPGK